MKSGPLVAFELGVGAFDAGFAREPAFEVGAGDAALFHEVYLRAEGVVVVEGEEDLGLAASRPPTTPGRRHAPGREPLNIVKVNDVRL